MVFEDYVVVSLNRGPQILLSLVSGPQKVLGFRVSAVEDPRPGMKCVLSVKDVWAEHLEIRPGQAADVVRTDGLKVLVRWVIELRG